MLTHAEATAIRERTVGQLKEAGIELTLAERASIEVVDFGLDMFDRIGLQLLVYVNTERVCAKELVLLPWQICPEHLHPDVAGEPGKEETFRCRQGEVLLHVPGERPSSLRARVPAGKEHTFTVWHEIQLRPGDQYTLPPRTKHWFQAGPEGAIVTEFSTRSRDELDVFTDRAIVRFPQAAD